MASTYPALYSPDTLAHAVPYAWNAVTPISSHAKSLASFKAQASTPPWEASPNPSQAGLISSSWSSPGTCPRGQYYSCTPSLIGLQLFIALGRDPELSGLAHRMQGHGLGEDAVSPQGRRRTAPTPPLIQCGVRDSSRAMKFHLTSYDSHLNETDSNTVK